MPATGAVRVEGLADLSRAFSRADRMLKTDLNDRLKEAAMPVQIAAEQLAVSRIRRVGIP